jgi:hypothetical protein
VIVEAFVNLLVGVADLIFSALGHAAAPGFVRNLGGQLSTIVDYSASMGAWVPWSALGVAIGAVMAAHVISLSVKVIRMLLSLFTGGGGAA